MASSSSEKVWGSLITNLDYLPGLLTLHHSLQSTSTQYPFVAFHTASFPESGLQALKARNIRTHAVASVQPGQSRDYAHDPRFTETWNKLVVFSLAGEYERIVLLDGDMLVRKNMDELMDVPLDGEDRVFAASHACACNPMKKAHYPSTWIPANCAFTTQHPNPTQAQTTGAPSSAGVGMLNSGLLVVQPSPSAWTAIQECLADPSRTNKYTFPDQELLSDVFSERWVALPYVYNALKTMRWEGVHDAIWRDDEVKNIHYIFATKPWHENGEDVDAMDDTNRWWWGENRARQAGERARGITDGF